jgi:hypothetical protein
MKITEGQSVRWYYGYAWRNYSSATFEVYIIPFNILFRWVRKIVMVLQRKTVDVFDEAYRLGYKHAKEENRADNDRAIKSLTEMSYLIKAMKPIK